MKPLLLAVAALALFALLHWGGGDDWVAAHFFDTDLGAFPARSGFWTEDVIHVGGRGLVILIATATAAVLLASWASPRWRDWRPAAAYVLACMALSTGGVALLKSFSEQDCPWNEQAYGGERLRRTLFEARPAGTPLGRCFPGGHSSGAFSLLAFYFLLRDRRPRMALAALALSLGLGLLFASAQWARGAHFPSHDLASLLIAWPTCALLARHWLLRPSLTLAWSR